MSSDDRKHDEAGALTREQFEAGLPEGAPSPWDLMGKARPLGLAATGFVRSVFEPETVIHLDLLDFEKKVARIYVRDGWTVETYPLPGGAKEASSDD